MVRNQRRVAVALLLCAGVVVPAAFGQCPAPTAAIPRRTEGSYCNLDYFVLTVDATGTSPLRYEWRKDGLFEGGGIGNRYMPNGQLLITYSGVYDCVVTDACGQAVTSPGLQVVIAECGRNSCQGDVDDGSGTGRRDGAVTIDDLIMYLELFAAADPRADIDGSFDDLQEYFVSIDDLFVYLDSFTRGC